MDVDKMQLDQVVEYIKRQANTIESQANEIKRLESYVLTLRREVNHPTVFCDSAGRTIADRHAKWQREHKAAARELLRKGFSEG